MNACNLMHWKLHEIAEYQEQILQFYEKNYLQYEDTAQAQRLKEKVSAIVSRKMPYPVLCM